MKIYSIPVGLDCLIFDIDSTLYTNPEYAREQVDVQIRHFAAIRGIPEREARGLIAEWQARHVAAGGGKPSLGNTFVALGVPIAESVRWREALLEPGNYLTEDARLREALETLSRGFTLVAVTNNPVLPARKTLEALGVSALFPRLIGLDTTGVSKPHEKPFLSASREANVPPQRCVSIGDRYDVDIAVPLGLGMGGILVDGVEDVYLLPEILRAEVHGIDE